MNDSPLWVSFLESARFCPSPHNVQPWRVRIVSDEEAELLYDPKRLLPVEDPTGCFNSVGLGMFVEALSIAAAEKGYSLAADYVDKKLDPIAPGLTLFSTLRLVKNKKKESLFPVLLRSRRTSRLPYEDRLVAQNLLDSFIRVAENFGQSLSFSTNRTMISWVLQLNCETVFDDMREETTRKELDNWLRYSKKQASLTRDGLWSYCMLFPGLLMYLFFHVRSLFDVPIISGLTRSAYLSSTKTTVVGWITGPFSSQKEWTLAGHMLLRLWLTMTKEGVYLHPFGSIITNKNAYTKLKEKFGIDEVKEQTWLLFRLGYSDTPPQSFRRSVEEILVRRI